MTRPGAVEGGAGHGWSKRELLLEPAGGGAVVLVLSVAVCTVYVGGSGFGFVGKDQSFEGTGYYQNEVLEQIYRSERIQRNEPYHK